MEQRILLAKLKLLHVLNNSALQILNPTNDSVDTVYHKEGGLKMPHIESKIVTQRIIYLKKYLENY